MTAQLDLAHYHNRHLLESKIAPWTVVGGNPAKEIKKRVLKDA